MQPQDGIIAQWQEPAADIGLAIGASKLRLSLIGLGVLAAAALTWGIWKNDATFYLGALAILAAAGSLYAQNRRPSIGAAVTLTGAALTVGNRSYPLKDLRGFWLGYDNGQLVVNVETKRRSALPIALLSPDTADNARAAFIQVLPELEPRATTLNDTISRWLRV